MAQAQSKQRVKRNLRNPLYDPSGVTPEMVSAGVIALDLYRESFADDLLVETIYNAMRAAGQEKDEGVPLLSPRR